jgi:beta-N-acetylhexosaminidase
MKLFAILFLISTQIIFANLSLDEKIGQLFVIPLTASMSEEAYQEGVALIDKYKIGGILLQKSTPMTQINMVTNLQKDRKIPLFTIQDAEWGLAMRLEGALAFPKNLTLGAIQNDDLIYKFGRELGRELQSAGVSIGLLPVVDINCNSDNPIIGDRSFGDNPYEVAKKGSLVLSGLKESKVIASAKHFPGHGNTYVDSHLEMPFIDSDAKRLNNYELVPFKKMISEGVQSIMVGHIQVGDIDYLPASLSSKFIKGILRKELNFEGLVITDALNMGAIKDNFSFDEAALLAYLAGNDLLLYGDHIDEGILKIYREFIPRAFAAIKNAIESGIISEKDLNDRVDKILKAKDNLTPIQEAISLKDLFPKSAYELNKELYRSALTYLSKKPKPLKFENVVYLKNLNRNFKDKYGLSDNILKDIYANKDNISLVVVLGSPYIVNMLPRDVNILVAYEENEDTLQAVEDFLAGKLEAKGQLPITIY